MVITLDNYEAFALDYLEGGLAPDKKAAFEAFLVEHPAIAEEIAAMATLPTLEPDRKIAFPDKKALLKSSFGSRLIPMWSRQKSLAVAASILFIFGIGVYFMSENEIGVTLEWNDEKFEGNYSLEVDTIKEQKDEVATQSNTATKDNLGNETMPSQAGNEDNNTKVASSNNQLTPNANGNKVAKSPKKGNTYKPAGPQPKTIPAEAPVNIPKSENVAETPKPIQKATLPPSAPEIAPAPQQTPSPVVAQTVTPQSKPTTQQQPNPTPKTNTPTTSTQPIAQAQPTEKPKTKFWNKVRDALLPEIVSENDKPVAKIQLPKVKFNFD